MTDNAPETPDRQSFSASPADSARAYQTGRDQTINEHTEHHHHHYAPRGAVRTGIVWSVAGALVVGLGAAVGVDLWDRHRAAETTTENAADSHVTPPAARTKKSTSPSPSQSHRPSTKPTKPTEQQAAAAAPERTPSPTAPSASCTDRWSPTAVPDVQVRPCARIEGGHVYMSAEWRTTSGHQTVDVHLWLEGPGTTVAYPNTVSLPNGVLDPAREAATTPQRTEFEVGTELEHGVKYEVCVSVTPAGGPGPKIAGAGVTGYQRGVVFS
ncbi:hypothetical protein ACGFYO_17380 [Streptomyces sp. NPDC048201]|uniref:hypothetical protein n=1 Tax=Streptomyces sp. NPDC048201 TaxID=3365513 RepID=UPI00370F88B2